MQKNVWLIYLQVIEYPSVLYRRLIPSKKVFRAKTLLKRSELIKLDFFGGLLRLRLNSAPSSTTERKFKKSVILGLGC